MELGCVEGQAVVFSRHSEAVQAKGTETDVFQSKICTENRITFVPLQESQCVEMVSGAERLLTTPSR